MTEPTELFGMPIEVTGTGEVRTATGELIRNQAGELVGTEQEDHN